MKLSIVDHAKSRHTVKAYAPAMSIPDETIAQVKDLLRFSASSINYQPWHFVLAGTEEGKARVAEGASGMFAYNKASIMNASHVVVFASKLVADDDHLRKVLHQEAADNRFGLESIAPQFERRLGFVNLHRHDLKDAQHWMDKQVYLNLGAFLLGVAALGIDATPMEGIDTRALDAEFDLRAQGYGSLFIVTLGYSDPEADFNAKLPKSRLPLRDILTEV
ncbi:oxygen-insensitive NAD(P)H nitroreductase [Cognatishimia sp. SS12]|uniref:oxygen-insensitive NAD(P)H nitroreductase n=1 Tax=Cognatishimia sp. SS12 TaxID=2979465 RepID=UPI00232AA4D9|nr:oxygen-insensitive NAD(P)H nitroreductase [Cognatishimia sp. SS12]MDC0738836.1 oxygen-insensitive NAD(P)H nitroreductase [Cognatishimia sp. SS12]